jgi:hypothetical protein
MAMEVLAIVWEVEIQDVILLSKASNRGIANHVAFQRF